MSLPEYQLPMGSQKIQSIWSNSLDSYSEHTERPIPYTDLSPSANAKIRIILKNLIFSAWNFLY